MKFSAKCDRAFAILADKKLNSRIGNCERVSEFGFALLLRFVQIEASLKILRYWQKTKNGWPDRFDFLRANWTPLRDLKALDSSKYDALIGAGGRSLLAIRNRIAHEGLTFDEDEYFTLVSLADWGLNALQARLPPKPAMREKVARLRTRCVKEGEA